MSDYKLQQFDHYYRMYDTSYEQAEPGDIARFDVNIDEAERIKAGDPFYVWRGEIIFETISEITAGPIEEEI